MGKFLFNCLSLNGVPLENNGGDASKGSHWEKDIFYNEYMTNEVTSN